MTMTTTTHLNFRRQAREALSFYQRAIGGDLVVVSYADVAAMGAEQAEGVTAEEMDLVVWGQVATADGFRLMAFDVPGARPYDAGTDAVFVSLRCTDEADVRRAWDGLQDGAHVRTPLGPAAFSPLYGMLTDRFGVTWVIDLAVEYSG